MEDFVLAGKAKTVFQILELRAKKEREEALKRELEKKSKDKK